MYIYVESVNLISKGNVDVELMECGMIRYVYIYIQQEIDNNILKVI